MTQFLNRPNNETVRETRVRIPEQMAAPIFQGWGPKF